MKNFKVSRIVVQDFFLMGIFSLICICNPTKLMAQQSQLHYKLIKGTDTVGSLQVTDSKIPFSRTIHCNMQADIPAFMFDIHLRDQKRLTFNNNVLESAVVTRSLFDRDPAKSVTILTNNAYYDGVNPIIALSGISKIVFSMAMLYTTEPSDEKVIYSEYHQQFVEIIKISHHAYKIETPEGQVGTYYYKKGVCIKVETKTSLLTIVTILVNNIIAFK